MAEETAAAEAASDRIAGRRCDHARRFFSTAQPRPSPRSLFRLISHQLSSSTTMGLNSPVPGPSFIARMTRMADGLTWAGLAVRSQAGRRVQEGHKDPSVDISSCIPYRPQGAGQAREADGDVVSALTPRRLCSLACLDVTVSSFCDSGHGLDRVIPRSGRFPSLTARHLLLPPSHTHCSPSSPPPHTFCDHQVLERAKGFALFSVVKAGFLLSARAGSGVVIAKLPDGTWSAPTAIGTAGVGFGGQAGAELTDFCIILNTSAAVKSFMAAGSLQLGGNMSVRRSGVSR